MRALSGERWEYSYDKMGNVTSETVRNAGGAKIRSVASAFDELGRLISHTLGKRGAAQWSYDKVDNITASATPNGHATTAAFDALDRVVSTLAPDGGTSAFDYDAAGNADSFTDPVSVTTQFVHNGFGELIQEVSPDRGTNSYWYDAAGRMTQSSDGRGQIIQYSYDYLGRLTQKTPVGRPASEIITYQWDSGELSGSYGVGRLAKVTDGTGITSFQYDHRGNLLAKQQAVGTSTAAQLAYTYDTADRITQIAYPSGRLVQYSYDSKGRVSSVQTKASAAVGSWTVIASNMAYDAFGPLASMDYGNGLAVAKTRGTDGYLASSRLYVQATGADLSSLAYRQDANGNIAAIADLVDPSQSVLYGYDEMDRLAMAVGGSGAQGASYNYTSGTNQLASLTDASGTRTIAYDARGNTASETRPGSVTASTTYDGYGRLTQYTRSDVGTADFTYNGLDDRTVMALPTAGTRHFVYDAAGRVMGEYGADATQVKAEFIWLQPSVAASSPFGGGDGLGGYMPLAVATPDTSGTIQLTWVHGDHLGVPLLITDASGNPSTTPDDYLAPGFPGQNRVFADLYYNRYRDYDSLNAAPARSPAPCGLPARSGRPGRRSRC